MATHSSTLAWKISWTEKPGGLPSMGSQRLGHNFLTKHAYTCSVLGKMAFSRALNVSPSTWKGTPIWEEPSLNNHQETVAKCVNHIIDFISCISFHLHKRYYEGAIIILTM